jgi:hypothetical protein
MNARELAISIKRSLNDDNGMFGPCHKIEFHRAHWETILSALALLAAAEANDGSTPKTDAMWPGKNSAKGGGRRQDFIDLARTLERRCSGLAAEVGRLKEDAERYRFLRDAEYPEPLLLMLREPGIHRNFVDAAIDAERAKP